MVKGKVTVIPSYKFSLLAIRNCSVLLLAAIVLDGAGCSKIKNEQAGGSGSVAANSNTAQSQPPSAAAAGTPTSWETKATSLEGKDGQTMTLACSPNGTPHIVWGSDIYTSDSSICTAAVHSGLITPQQGGTVTIEIRPGRSVYGASERNGVTTSAYGSWAQSFVFKTANTDAVVRAADDATPVLWNTSPGIVNFEAGKTLKFHCPPNGTENRVWGTDTYTLDSSLCTAAVHAGKIKLDTGGDVTIEMRPGESSYKGSLRNGIKSDDYGQYGTSFILK
jgi:hypothetical protein